MSNEIKTHPLSVLDDPKDYLVGDIDEYLLKQMDNPEVDKIPGRETIYIVAGNPAEFEQYVLKKKEEYRRRKPEMRESAKPMPYYHYVKNKYDLMGLTQITGYYIGTASKRADIKQIKQAIEYVKERAELLGKDTTYTFSQLFATQWDTEDM
jgi:hypothetical protein